MEKLVKSYRHIGSADHAASGPSTSTGSHAPSDGVTASASASA